MKVIKGFFKTLYVCSLLIMLGSAVTGAAYVGGYLPKDVEAIERIVPVAKPEPSLTDLIERVPPAYGVSSTLVKAVIQQESGGKKDAYRFEPSQMARAAKFSKNVEQQRMLASSHCAMQVMGYNAARLGLSWSELYDLETCVEVGVKILKECLDRHEGKPKYQKYYHALWCYNGGEKYAAEVLNGIGRALIEEHL